MEISISRIQDYASRYPQLLLPIRPGISLTDEYKNVVLKGKTASKYIITFNNDEIIKYLCETPAGKAEIIHVPDREDFEHLYQALAYKCEPHLIPSSVGAVIINGVINWEKINHHKTQYLIQGNTDWKDEFKRFTSDRNNYCDSIILISSGPYSSIPAEKVYLSGTEWEVKSVIIRMYHELTHFVCRKLYPEKKDIIRDEIYADCIGLIAAFGTYDPLLAKVFLGIETEIYRIGGRLEHYAPKCLREDIHQAQKWIEEAKIRVAEYWDNNMSEEMIEVSIFDLLMQIY